MESGLQLCLSTYYFLSLGFKHSPQLRRVWPFRILIRKFLWVVFMIPVLRFPTNKRRSCVQVFADIFYGTQKISTFPRLLASSKVHARGRYRFTCWRAFIGKEVHCSDGLKRKIRLLKPVYPSPCLARSFNKPGSGHRLMAVELLYLVWRKCSYLTLKELWLCCGRSVTDNN
jgi:hypothetical protein